ncbi:hypothetical protein OG800_49820 (plasmid) [Streptomyces sp. NBC_00445]|uniref:hypothetical protein n=1 Tax=Streptomyces sp. NBC_00445 TaxID=2975745 RepID=UPI002E24ED2F
MQFNDPILALLATRARLRWNRLRSLREDDRGGISIEAMIIVGSLVAIAGVAAGILLIKVNEKGGQVK